MLQVKRKRDAIFGRDGFLGQQSPSLAYTKFRDKVTDRIEELP